jgi:hypothetical protein
MDMEEIISMELSIDKVVHTIKYGLVCVVMPKLLMLMAMEDMVDIHLLYMVQY